MALASAKTPSAHWSSPTMSNTIPLPEPIAWLFRTLPAGGSWELALSDDAGKPPWNARSEKPLYTADQMHAHAAAVSAAKDAEIAGLREYLDAAQRRGEELRAQVAALTENGPPMQRGTTIEGTPWMGTMREVLEDYKSAADTEAKWGDEARAEVAGLRSTLADSRAYVERLKKRIDEMMTERDVLIKVLEAMKQDDKDAEMAQLREYLDAAQRRASALGEEAINLRAQRDAARADWVALREDAARGTT